MRSHFGNVAGHEARKLLRRHRHRQSALLGPRFSHIGPARYLCDLRTQTIDDIARRVLRRHDPQPDHRVAARHSGFGHRRNIGQHGRALSPVVPNALTFRCARDRSSSARRRTSSAPGLPAHRCARPSFLCTARGRYHTCHRLEQLARHVIRRAIAGRCVVQLFRLGLRKLQQLGQIVGRHRWMDDENEIRNS